MCFFAVLTVLPLSLLNQMLGNAPAEARIGKRVRRAIAFKFCDQLPLSFNPRRGDPQSP